VRQAAERNRQQSTKVACEPVNSSRGSRASLLQKAAAASHAGVLQDMMMLGEGCGGILVRVDGELCVCVCVRCLQGEYGSTAEVQSSQRSGRKGVMIAICAASMLLVLAALTMDKAPEVQERLQLAGEGKMTKLAAAAQHVAAKAHAVVAAKPHSVKVAPAKKAVAAAPKPAAAPKAAVKLAAVKPAAAPKEVKAAVVSKPSEKVAEAKKPHDLVSPLKAAAAVTAAAVATKQQRLAAVKPVIAKGNMLQDETPAADASNSTSTDEPSLDAPGKPEGIVGDDVESDIGNLKPTGQLMMM